MFRITVVNLSIDARKALPDTGSKFIGELYSDQLRDLLEQFRALDPVESATTDPEIIIETRRIKHIVRTGLNRLYLYDPRDVQAPALVLTAEEIIAELDGSAAAARTRAPFVPPTTPEDASLTVTAPTPPKPAPRTHLRLTLGLTSLGLAGYLGFAMLSAQSPSPAAGFELFADLQESDAKRTAVSGVYMTGQNPGDHGIALVSDGTMKLFQLNAGGTPSLIRDRFKMGRIDGQLCALGTETAAVIRFTGPEQLTYGGEVYRRLP